MLFPVLSIDMTIQSQPISVHTLTSQLYIFYYARKKLPFTSYLAAKHPKHHKFAITNMREKPADFLLYNTSVDFSFSKILST